MLKLNKTKLALCMMLVTAPAMATQWASESTDAAANSAPDPQRADPVAQEIPAQRVAPQTVEESPRVASANVPQPVAATVSTASTNVSSAECKAAKDRLTQLQSQEEKLWSSQTEAGDLYRIWSSEKCKAERRGKSNIQQDLASVMVLLKSNGTDIETQLAGETTKCEAAASSKWNAGNAEFKRQHSPAALAETCMLNTRITLYSKALNRLNQNEQSRGNAAQSDYETARAKYEEEQRAYAAERAEWRRRVDLCNAGKTKYCSEK